jgi:methylated-DNA-[protein]-cysteine S-methyltransferase
MKVFSQEMPSPIGKLTLVSDASALTHVHMDCGEFSLPAGAKKGHAVLGDTRRQLEEYFAGKRVEFNLPMAAQGTEFQRQVWAALYEIPFAETRSYIEIARAIGKPKGPRAVGMANGRNPIGIIVPCHRVIGANGTLTGYGGGLERKQWLLDHEREVAKRLSRANVS